MDHIGIDVHKNASQVCIRTDALLAPRIQSSSTGTVRRSCAPAKRICGSVEAPSEVSFAAGSTAPISRSLPC